MNGPLLGGSLQVRVWDEWPWWRFVRAAGAISEGGAVLARIVALPTDPWADKSTEYG